MREQAEIVVPVPIGAVQQVLQDVESWPQFVVGLESVVPLAHQRYLFGVRFGSRLHEILTAVVPHPAQGRFGWTAINAPRWDASIRVNPLDPSCTAVRMVTRAEPRSFLGVVAEAFGAPPRRAEQDLLRLQALAVSRSAGRGLAVAA